MENNFTRLIGHAKYALRIDLRNNNASSEKLMEVLDIMEAVEGIIIIIFIYFIFFNDNYNYNYNICI